MRKRDRGESRTTSLRSERYQSIVEHFEQIARAHVRSLTHVSNLSRIAKINQRTLSRAFRETRGVGPYRYLLGLRLNEVRHVLLSEDGTVTEAAMRFGFRELGKFGVLYRKAFGESPSQTKRHGKSAQVERLHEASHAPHSNAIPDIGL
jgi:transcriptional regulator GlxA family with amidase domain